MRTLVLPLVLGLSLVTGCSVAVTAKTQTRYTRDITSQSTKADWTGQTITVDDATLDVLINGGITVRGDPAATKVTVTGRAVAYADATDQASADLTINDVLATLVIAEAADTIAITCGHGTAHGTSTSNHSGCEALQITVPAGSAAKPLPLVVKAGQGDVTVTGTVGWLDMNNNDSLGTLSASHTPVKGAAISLKGGGDVSLAVPKDFAADLITLTADKPTDVDTSAFSDVSTGKGRGVAGTGAGSLVLASTGLDNKVILKSQ